MGSDEALEEETYRVIGAAMAVHSELGSGFLERVYAEALHQELVQRRIPFRSEVPLPIYFKGVLLGVTFRVDLMCFGRLLVELKRSRGQDGLNLPRCCTTSRQAGSSGHC